MGQDEISAERSRLLEAARALLVKGDAKFSIAALCAEAGLERAQFRGHFSGKAALLSALTQQEKTEPATPAPPPDPKAAQEPGIPTPDAWLERRLRVFERALNALEEKAETRARDQARAIALLEEKLFALGKGGSAAAGPKAVAAVETPEEIPQAQAEVGAEAGLKAASEPAHAPRSAAPELLMIEKLPVVTVSREEMADVLQTGRDAARQAADRATLPPEPDDRGRRLRWLAIGALSLLALFLCAGLTMGSTARATASQGEGVSRRQVAAGAGRVIALADAGDANAQAALALSYLRGDDVSAAARWSISAAQAGQPVAETLLGTLYGRGMGVRADPAKAFALFADAARKGNLRAMHNLAIAYAQGAGTARDDARAAEWFTRAAERGNVDSAFDLAVLHERGLGVKQDLKAALTWYGIAALAGDAPSRQRAETLRGQLDPRDVQLAANAARSFAPLPPLGDANRVRGF